MQINSSKSSIKTASNLSETENLLPNSPGEHSAKFLATTNGHTSTLSLLSKKSLTLCLLIVTIIFLCYSIELPMGMSSVGNYWTLIGEISGENVIKKLFNQKGGAEKEGDGIPKGISDTQLVNNGISQFNNGTSQFNNGTSQFNNVAISPKTSPIPPKQTTEMAEMKLRPIIIGWNRFYSQIVYDFRYLVWGFDNCSFKCIFTEDKKLENLASAFLFHGAQPLGEAPKQRRPDQLFTMVSHESPDYCHPSLGNLPANYFNVSITYHTDSTIYIPYEQFNPITSQTPPEEIWTEDEIMQRMALKRRFALQIVSHCNAPSGRDQLTEQLQKLIELDVFGRCNKKPCDEKCYQQQLDSHFFYMAFENAVCPQYVTEKFWNSLRSLVVPVVLNRATLKEAGIPDDVYIAADDFESVKELADYLKALQKDTKRYLGYLNWTKRYRRHWDHNTKPTALCQLCEIIHKQKRKDQFQNYTMRLDTFWSEKSCQANWVQDKLFKKHKHLGQSQFGV